MAALVLLTLNFSAHDENILTGPVFNMALSVALIAIVSLRAPRAHFPVNRSFAPLLLFLLVPVCSAFFANGFGWHVLVGKEVSLRLGYVLFLLLSCNVYISEKSAFQNVTKLLFYAGIPLALEFWLYFFFSTKGYGSNGLLLTGHYLALYLIVVALLFLQFHKPSKTLLFLLAFFLVTVLFSGSRAAYLTLAAAVLTWTFLRFRHRMRTRHIVAGVSALLVLAALLWLLRPVSVNGRFILWQIGATAIDTKSLFLGHGSGFIESHIALLQSRFFENRPPSVGFYGGSGKTLLNDYLKVLVENGAVGIVLGILAVFHCARVLFRKRLFGMLSALLGIIVFAFFSDPSFSIPLSLLLLSIFACALSLNPSVSFGAVSRWKKVPAILVFTVLIGINLYHCRAVCRWKALARKPIEASDTKSLQAFYALMPVLGKNGHFLNDHAIRLNQLGRFAEARKILDAELAMQSTLSGYLNSGFNYEQLGLHAQAEKHYRTAINMQPKLFYPKFLLFDMFRSSGKTLEAIRYGEEVLNHPVKIENPETQQIRDEIADYLRKNKP